MAEVKNETLDEEVEQEKAKRSYNKKFSQDEVNAMIAEASRKAAIEAVEAYKASQPQTVVQVAKDEYVTILFIGAIAEGTTVSMPKWGQINYAGGMLDIPKKEFLQGIGVQVNNALLRERQIIVLSGLTDEERRRFGVDYKDGEYLTVTALYELIGYDTEKICDIFAKLCNEHKRIVAKIFIGAYFDKHDNRINRDTVKALNSLSKSVDKDGLFTPILEDMGARDAE